MNNIDNASTLVINSKNMVEELNNKIINSSTEAANSYNSVTVQLIQLLNLTISNLNEGIKDQNIKDLKITNKETQELLAKGQEFINNVTNH